MCATAVRCTRIYERVRAQGHSNMIIPQCVWIPWLDRLKMLEIALVLAGQSVGSRFKGTVQQNIVVEADSFASRGLTTFVGAV
jgi:hypothetical protein